MRAIGYARVSTEEQAREGVSLDAQRARIRAWCTASDHALSAEDLLADAGISGKRADNRPALAEALDRACAAPGRVLVVYSLSRLARSVKATLAIAERMERSGAELVSLSESIDTTTAAGKMVFRMLAVLAEFESDLVAERTRGGLAFKRSRGERVGTIPVGFRICGDGKGLDPDGVERGAVARMRRLALQGCGPRSIARDLATAGILGRGDRPWSESTIRRILARPDPW